MTDKEAVLRALEELGACDDSIERVREIDDDATVQEIWEPTPTSARVWICARVAIERPSIFSATDEQRVASVAVWSHYRAKADEIPDRLCYYLEFIKQEYGQGDD